MILSAALSGAIAENRLKVWVLAPNVISDNDTIGYYYDFSHSMREFARVFSELNIDWIWQPVTIGDYKYHIGRIYEEKISGTYLPVVLNLCDGDEINGAPGVSVIRSLKEKGIIFTGADEYFYTITTSKVPMKKAFDGAGVRTAPWLGIRSNSEITADKVFDAVGKPMILKPAVSGGSMGVSVKNVIETPDEFYERIDFISNGYQGWNLTADGIIAEKFISGPEFTTFITGSYHNPEAAVVYTPVERVFHDSLPEKERFLSFDRLWELYENESPMPGEENFYEYRLPDASLIAAIQKLSWDAYCATGGTGYTRVDIRMDEASGELYVLEVNAQPGLSDNEGENHTSIGAILRLSEKSFSGMILEIINDAFIRNKTIEVTESENRSKTRA